MVGEDPEKPVIDGRKADALLAAHYASEAALRLVKPGNEVRGPLYIYIHIYIYKKVNVYIEYNQLLSNYFIILSYWST